MAETEPEGQRQKQLLRHLDIPNINIQPASSGDEEDSASTGGWIPWKVIFKSSKQLVCKFHYMMYRP